jgi:hypothetical protein
MREYREPIRCPEEWEGKETDERTYKVRLADVLKKRRDKTHSHSGSSEAKVLQSGKLARPSKPRDVEEIRMKQSSVGWRG